jgi:hypothetical protein
MTDKHPETAPIRKVRVSTSCPPTGNPEYWGTHVPISCDGDDPTFDEAEEGLDEWIAKRNRA